MIVNEGRSPSEVGGKKPSTLLDEGQGRRAISSPVIIGFCNQKGGVGKTTTAINLAASVAAAEKHTLLIDFDPQANASSGIGIQKNSTTSNSYTLLQGKALIPPT